MAKRITTENVVVGADTTKYETAMQRCKRVAGDFGNSTVSMGGKLVKASAAFAAAGVVAVGAAGVAAAAGLASVWKATAESADQTAKLADKLGVTTQAYEAYKHAAGLAGASDEALMKGLERLVRLQGDAAAGNQTAADAFARLGISQTELATLGTEELFERVADSVAGIPNAADRASAAYALFGRQGADLANFLMAGSASIRDAKAELEDWGGALTRVDAAKVEAANDSISRVGKAIEIVGQKFTVEFAPYVDAAAKAILAWGFSGGKAANLVVDGVESVVVAVAKIADVWALAEAGFLGFRSLVGSGLSELAEASAAFVGAYANAVNGVREATGLGRSEALDALAEFQNDFAKSLKAGAADDLTAGLDAMDRWETGAASTAVTEFFDGVRAKAQESAEAIAKAAEEQQAFRSQLEKLAETDEAGAKVKVEVGDAEKAIAELQRKIDTFGMTDVQVKLADLADSGATEEQIAKVRELMAELQSLEAAAAKPATNETPEPPTANPVGAQSLEGGSVASLLQLQRNAAENKDAVAAHRQREEQKRLAERGNRIAEEGFVSVVEAINGGGLIDLGVA